MLEHSKIINNHEKIRQWVAMGESVQLEFKLQTPKPYKIAKTIGAFANSKGGRIIIGVLDNGEITGVVNPLKEQQLLLDAAQQYCRPSVAIKFDEHHLGHIIVVVATISQSKTKPHYSIGQNGEENVYIRTNASTRIASKIVIKQLMNYYPDQQQFSRSLTSKEQGLISHLRRRENITLKEFMVLMNLSKRRARRMLVQLCQDQLIYEHTDQKEPYYTLA
jgi:predicted HTH transcriptional regulator